ncbi:MAG TPA: hypothetical protein VEZ24_18920 [Microvirga sp.]|nr:hypothetical protein [Microvirga sp.]
MRLFPKPASVSRIGLICAVLGVSIATQAHAFFIMDERPPPNGANGSSLNGLTVNGLTVNGLTVNGLTVNGRNQTGRASHSLVLQAVALPDGERIELH